MGLLDWHNYKDSRHLKGTATMPAWKKGMQRGIK